MHNTLKSFFFAVYYIINTLMQMNKIVTIKKLHYHYDTYKTVLKDLDLSIDFGKIYVLAGQNGAGKSTLFKLMQGLIFKEKGSIDVLGFRPEQRHPDMLASVYLVTDNMYLPKTEIEALPDKLGFYYPAFDKDVFEQCLADFNLSKLKKTYGLSQGEKKKLVLAFGFATQVPYFYWTNLPMHWT